MTEKYRSLEHTIREQARKAMQEKMEARMRLTTKILEKKEPPQEIKEEVTEGEYYKAFSSNTPGPKDSDGLNKNTPESREKERKAAEDRVKAKRAARAEKKEEVEIDELSPGTLGSYVKKAARVLPSKEMEVDGIYHHGWDDKNSKKVRADIHKRETRIKNHYTGIDRATDRLIKKEEVEIEEISKEKLEKYVYRAVTDHGMANFGKRMTTNPKEKAAYTKAETNRKKGISTAINKLDKKEEVEAPEIEIVELAPANVSQQDAQRQRLQKQKQAMQAQLQKQKQAKAAQDAKDRSLEQDELKKARVESVELDERTAGHVHNYERAAKLQNLHNRLYNRLSAAGNLHDAEKHRKKAVEYKRIAYAAKDNPGRLGPT
jgi:hypothetical protein